MHYPTKIDVACCGTRFPVKRRRVYICAPHDFTDTSVCRLSPVVVHVGDNALAEMIMTKLSTGGAACRVLCGKTFHLYPLLIRSASAESLQLQSSRSFTPHDF